MILGELLYEKSESKSGSSPIKSLNFSSDKANLAIKVSSTHQGYTGAFLIFKQLLQIGELILLESNAKLNQAEFIQVPNNGQPYNLLVSFPAWLPDVIIQIWEVLEVPFSSISGSTSISQRKGKSNPTTVTASATPVGLVAARAGRVGLDILNESAATLFVKYAAVTSPASPTDKDIVIPPNTVYEFPGLPPESAINGRWTAANGSCTVIEWTEQ